ncbi:MAG: ABC transporter permease [Thermoanaerobaculia bacterium]
MSVVSDLRSAARALRRSASTTILAVLTLALALGAATAMFSAIQAILLRPLPYDDPERIVRLSPRSGPGDDADQMSWLNYEDLRDGASSLETAAAYSRTGMFVYPGGEPELIYGLDATYEFFDVLGVHPAIGRAFTAEDDRAGAPDVMLISWAFWQSRLGGDPAVIGKPVQVSATGETRVVIGIMPRGFRYPYDDKDVHYYAPLRPELSEVDLTERAQVWANVVARLAPGATAASANAELEAMSLRLEEEYPAANTNLVFRAYPIYDEIVGEVEPALWVLFAAVGAVLLIGCANVANLLLARAAGRVREVAVRSALGASRARIVRQLLIESLGTALVAGLLGIAIGAAGLRVLVAIAPPDIPRLDGIDLDWRVILFGIGLSLATGLLFGLAPALITARSSTSNALREGTRGTTEGRGRGRLRESLVVAEIAMALLLLPAAGLLLRSFWNLTSIDPGFDDRNVTMLDVSFPSRHDTDEQIMQAFRVLKERVEAIPGVEAVASSRTLPYFQSGWVEDFTVVGRPEPPPGYVPISALVIVSPGYFETMRVPIVRGRAFTERDGPEAPRVTIISESFARQHFAGEDPIGQRLALGSGTLEIVGVAGDVREFEITKAPMPARYVPLAQRVNRRVRYLVRTAPGAGPIAAELRAAVRAFDPVQPIVEIRPLSTYRAESFASRRLALWLLVGLAGLAFALSAIGIYSVMSYTVSRRRSEIGVRMAFGAEPRDIFRLIVRRVATLLGLGAVLGLAGALAGTRIVGRFLYGLSPTDPLTFAAILALLGGIALLAGYFPARRAARVDPLVAIRYE